MILNMKKGMYVYGYYGAGNVGDELLLETILSNIDSKIDTVYIKSHSKTSGFSNRTCEIDFYPPLLNGGKLEFLIYYFNRLLSFLKISSQIRYFVFGGGSIITASTSLVTLIHIYLMLLICKVRRISVIGLGMGVSLPGNGLKRMLALKILKSIHFCFIRDSLSYQQLISVLPDQKIKRSSDLVFSVKKNRCLGPPQPLIQSSAKRNVAITICPQFLEPRNRTISGNDMKAKGLRRLVEYLLSRGYRVCILGFQSSISSEGDINGFKRLVVDGNKELDSQLQYIDISSDNVFKIYKELDFVIGMRLHSLILAATCKIPFCGLSFDPKVDGLCLELEVPVVTPGELASADDYFWERVLDSKLSEQFDEILSSMEISAVGSLKVIQDSMCLQ